MALDPRDPDRTVPAAISGEELGSEVSHSQEYPRDALSSWFSDGLRLSWDRAVDTGDTDASQTRP